MQSVKLNNLHQVHTISPFLPHDEAIKKEIYIQINENALWQLPLSNKNAYL